MAAIQIPSISSAEQTSVVEKGSARQEKIASIQATFSKYMSQSSANHAQTSKQQAVIPSSLEKTQSGGVQQEYRPYQSKTLKPENASSAQTGTDSAEAADQTNRAVEDALTDVKELIKEELGISDEQLEAAMELLGMTQVDLLQPQQLAALTVELTGSMDVGAVLFNENFQNILQGVSEITDSLLQDLGMSMDQLITQVTEQLQAGSEQTAQQDIEAPVEEQLQPTEQLVNADMDQPVQEGVLKLNSFQQAAEAQNASVTDEISQIVEVAEEEQSQEALQAPQQTEEGEAEDTKPQQADLQTQKMQPQEQDARAGGGEEQTKNLWEGRQEHTRFDIPSHVHQEQNANPLPLTNAGNQALPAQIDVQDVIRQIVEYTRLHLAGNEKSIEMQLNPENLGKVYLHISEKQGAVTAQIAAQNESLKEALVQQAAILKENLNQQGIKVEAVEVSVGTHEFESNLEKDARQQEEQARQQEEQHNRNSRRSINLNELNELEGLSGLMSEEETLVAQMMRDNGNNVDYKA